MSSVLNNAPVVGHQTAVDDTAAPKVPWVFAFGLLLLAGALFGVYRWYQQYYSFTVGMDYFEPEFQVYWMSLFYIQMTVIPLVGLIAVVVLWLTRDKQLHLLSPQMELRRYYYIFSVLAVASFLAVVAFGLFVEADAAWHQTTIRDTDFTPTHIALFYFAIPAALVGLVFGFVWVHTRLPDFANRISVPLGLAVAGPILIMPNLGLNEWGHTFFYAEELFAAPIHWGFVVLAWALYALGGFVLQCIARVHQLTKLPDESSTTSVA
ncbi:MAG: methane monooxygenase/ammonia monooxygenase subunit C [Pseudomonadota bacterium]|nr:methane monooxygenase/ammonia monooxygenase subunit C [Pseudomonadota bacterium]